MRKIVLTQTMPLLPPSAGGYGPVRNVGRGRGDAWGRRSPSFAAAADSDSSHSTVIMLRRSASRTSVPGGGGGGGAASVIMLEADSASKWRLPLLCLLLAACCVAVVAPAVATLSRSGGGGGAGGFRPAVNDAAASVPDSGKPQFRPFTPELLRRHPSIMSFSEGKGGHGKDDEVREVVRSSLYKSV